MKDSIALVRWDRSLQKIVASTEFIAREKSLCIRTELNGKKFVQSVISMSSDWNSYYDLASWCIGKGFKIGEAIYKIDIKLPLSKDNIKFEGDTV